MAKRALKTAEVVVVEKKLSVSLDTEQVITIFKPFARTVSWYADSSDITDFYILVSPDGENFFEFLARKSTTCWADTKDIAFPWVALKAAEAPGQTANLLIAAC